MATRSNIGIEREDGSIETIYCHWDGYPANQLLYLKKFGLQEVLDLLSLGDLSSLKERIHPRTENHSYDNPEKDVCVFYARDRGEEFQAPRKFNSKHEAFENEWLYLFVEKEGKWIYTGNGIFNYA